MLLPILLQPASAPKRAGDTFQGLRAIQTFVGQDDAGLTTPAYVKYKAEAEASGTQPLRPLGWHLLSELGPLDVADQGPPSERTCTERAAGEHMEEEANL